MDRRCPTLPPSSSFDLVGQQVAAHEQSSGLHSPHTNDVIQTKMNRQSRFLTNTNRRTATSPPYQFHRHSSCHSHSWHILEMANHFRRALERSPEHRTPPPPPRFFLPLPRTVSNVSSSTQPRNVSEWTATPIDAKPKHPQRSYHYRIVMFGAPEHSCIAHAHGNARHRCRRNYQI